MSEGSSSRGRALVVDDDAETRGLIEMLLRHVGFTVATADSGAAAIRGVEATPPDVVVTDLHMPGMDGVELLGKLRERAPDLPVLVVTASGEVTSAVAAMRAGAEDYLTKPIDFEALRFSIERALERRKQRAETDLLRRTLAELRDAHLALGQERDFIAAVLDTIGALVVVLDREGRVLRFNRACEETTGFSASEVVGAPIWDRLICPEELGGVQGVFAALVSGEQPRKYENHWMTKSGGRRLIAWSNTMLFDEEGRVRHVVATGIDVTETRELAARIRRSEHLASLATVSAGVAHEIRNPLNAASLHLTLLRRLLSGASPDIPGSLEAVGITTGEITRVSALLEEFLQFARPKPLRRIQVDLRQLSDEVLALCRVEASVVGLELASGGEAALEVSADEPRMRQVLLNLVRNAMEATGAGGRVRVEVERGAEAAVIRVEDNGPGLGVDEEQIFEPFFTTKETGTGLGLAITHRIIVDHGGDISVKSRPGCTVFTICLPYGDPAAR